MKELTDARALLAESSRLQHVILTPKAVKGLRKLRRFVDWNTLWRHLDALENYLWRLLFLEPPGFDLAKRFRELSGIELRRGEGRQTNRCRRMMALRQLVDKDRAFDMTWHTGQGHHDSNPRAFRLYLAVDRVERQILVGHVGGHLENYSTQYEH